MLNNKRHNRAKKILNWWYNRFSSTNSEKEKEIEDKFAIWVADATDGDEKERELEELFDRELKKKEVDFTISSEELKTATIHHLSEIDKRRGVSEGSQQLFTIKKGGKPFLSKRLIRVAAVLIPAVIIFGGYWFINRDSGAGQQIQYAELKAEKGERKDYTLADSTKVWVNAESKLVVTQTKTERVAELSGESYFVVSRDEKRPFVVNTEDITISVLGTEFNVIAYPGDEYTTVTLTKGRVGITTPSQESFTLDPSQQFAYHRPTGKSEIKMLDPEKADESTQWTKGMLVLDDVTVEQALKMIGRRYNINVVINNRDYIDEIMMGKFDENTTLEDVMFCITTTYPDVKYTFSEGTITIE